VAPVTTTTTSIAAVVPPSTTSTTPPPETVLSGPPTVPTLPRTGVDAVAFVLLAAGLILLGAAASDVARLRIR
jgi:LPXTG-motif cell wall-anchored protein